MAPIRIAVIGGGPGAMFFCHALNQQKRNHDGPLLSTDEIQVTCFEKAATPGGIWRSERKSASGGTSANNKDGADSSAYDELWTNGPSHCLELYDYTFDEHFQGEPVPVYLPRRDVNEYLIQRVTRNAPTFFEDYFMFETEVINVSEVTSGDDMGKFCVKVRSTQTGQTSTRFFEKCIWAAGENAKVAIPAALLALFQSTPQRTTTTQTEAEPELVGSELGPEMDVVRQHYDRTFESSGKRHLLHSTETTRIRERVSGKRVLLIGGGYSAEDLAFQCIKWGASHVDVASRSSESEVTWVAKWPGDRVDVHAGVAVKALEDDGAIVLENVEFDWPHTYLPACPDVADNENRDDNEKKSGIDAIPTTVLRNIDIVVFCTGYQANLSMLDEALRPPSGHLPAFYMGMHPSMSLDAEHNFSWDKWSMATNHPAHKYTGHVPAGQGKMIRTNYNHPDMHRGILLTNPKMMFLCEHGSDIPLLSLDAHAWLLCAYVTGLVTTPSVQQLREANRQQVLDQMHLPHLRYYMDEGYFRVLDSSMPDPVDDEEDDEEDEDDDDASSCDGGYWDEDYWKAYADYSNYMFRLLSRVMEEGKYPGISLGTYKKLNNNGKAFIRFSASSDKMRANKFGNLAKGAKWRTFRDDETQPKKIRSLYTGSAARPLKKPWMDAIGPTCSVKNGDI